MFSITETSCRICLAECLDSAEDFQLFVQDFEELTKFKYFEDDVPRKVCDSCLQINLTMKYFLKTCHETEKILNEYRKSKEYKLDVIQEVYIKSKNSLDINSDPLDMELETFEILPVTDDNSGNTKIDLRKSHLSNKTQKSTIRILCCDICGKEVFSSYLRHHMRSHANNIQKPILTCDICGYTNYDKDRLRFHMRQKHLKVIQYNCHYCNRVYRDSSSLKFHTTHNHTKEFSHYCTVCKKGFISAYRLSNHMSKHTDIRRFNCDICGDSFKSGQYLGSHKREVHSDKEFSCNECTKVFKCMKLLRQHQQFHKPNTFKCPLCHQTFSVGHSLRSHMKKTHEELPLPPKGVSLRNIESLDSYLALCI